MSATKRYNRQNKGAVLIVSMLFVLVFSALAISLAALSGSNVQVASNQHKVNTALLAAQSGLACGQYIIHTVSLGETSVNYVTDTQANASWATLSTYVHSLALDGKTVPLSRRFSNASGAGDEIVTPAMDYSDTGATFVLRFYRYDGSPKTIKLQATGTDGPITRRISLDMSVAKDNEVLSYAVASRGRMWLTGDTTVHGSLFSAWHRAEVSPFNMTHDSTVLGTIGTVLTLHDIQAQNYHLETLDANGHPIDANGAPLGDDYAERYYGSTDQIQAYHQGINYSQTCNNMPGMDISDYNTDAYTSGLTSIATSSQHVTEYFPHAAGNYTRPKDGGSTSFSRSVYQNQTYTNAKLPQNRHALFKNCTFQGVLYIDSSKTSTSKAYTNNVRFEDCTFNGVVITNVPQSFNWVNNCLYFTGGATFNNRSAIQEATILAPHFNVNLGNTNPQQSDNNVLTGAIVGGIVDVRGNAQIYGTIISMCDTTQWTNGYVTNIGATLNDGGSETTEVGDIGVIGITPQEDRMLPSGITSPIILKPDKTTYSESA